MKSFACGDVVPGCRARWEASSEDEILHLVGAHATAVHGFASLPDDVVHAVRSAIVTV